MNSKLLVLALSALLFVSKLAFAQPGSENFDKVWVHGEAITFTTTFEKKKAPDNQIYKYPGLYFTHGNSGICDSAGNPILISDGFNLYDRNLKLLENSYTLVPWQMFDAYGFSPTAQSSIILPFANGKYRLVNANSFG
jgi:hypothetical protein